MIKPTLTSHWYTPKGEPAYNATLREARKETLYPSVTSIIGILEKPAVTTWKVNTMLDCAWNVPKDSCDVETWKEIVEDRWEDETSKAAKKGTAIHSFCEDFITGSGKRIPEYLKQCELIESWIMDNIDTATCETSFAYEGYGGRIDCHGFLKDSRPFVLDFKTQDMKGKNKPTYYPEFAMQLSAYRAWLIHKDQLPHVAISVLIDTSDIQCIHVKEYTQEEMDKAYYKFLILKSAFYAIKELV